MKRNETEKKMFSFCRRLLRHNWTVKILWDIDSIEWDIYLLEKKDYLRAIQNMSLA